MNKIRRLILPPAREAKFRAVIARRQPTLAVCLENVFDPHNLAAVLRTCDSVGVMDVYVLQTEESLRKPLVLGKKSSGGSRKWVDVHLHTDVESCFSALRARYGRILGTALGKSSTGLYQLDLAQPVALVFGNEHRGLSPEASAACDGHFMIPQMGMPESLNLSVACAVSLYEAHRQRAAAGMYDVPQLSPEEAHDLYMRYLEYSDSRKGWLEVSPDAS
jgi:tRNA (guanosine-2'-O-)-methyltransferase